MGNPTSKETAEIHYTEDVKEAFHQARHIAKRRPAFKESQVIFDWEYLTGLLYSNRAFARLDCLLNQIGIKPKKFKKQLEEISKENESSNDETKDKEKNEEKNKEDKENASQSFIERAEAIAHQDLEESARLGSARLNIEHLLYAFCQSSDPTVQKVLEAVNLNSKTLDQAKKTLFKKSGNSPFSKLTLLSGLYLLRETFEIIFTVIVFLVIIKEGFGELRLIPSESMFPGLQIGDRLIVEKVTRWWRPFHREDILVFYPPPPRSVLHQDPFSIFMRATGFSSLLHNSSADPVDKAYIKRVIGLPGETVEVVPGVGVYINGLLLEEDDYAPEVGYKCGLFCEPTLIPEDHYLMMGDNRNNSEDGRFFGFEPKDRVVGRAVFRILPVPRIGLLD